VYKIDVLIIRIRCLSRLLQEVVLLGLKGGSIECGVVDGGELSRLEPIVLFGVVIVLLGGHSSTDDVGVLVLASLHVVVGGSVTADVEYLRPSQCRSVSEEVKLNNDRIFGQSVVTVNPIEICEANTHPLDLLVARQVLGVVEVCDFINASYELLRLFAIAEGELESIDDRVSGVPAVPGYLANVEVAHLFV